MKINIKSKIRDYEIFIENGLLKEIDNYLDVSRKYAIIADDNIPDVIINRVINKLNNNIFIDFPHGEKSKSLFEYERIINSLIDKGMTKNYSIIALGGGVTGDLAGFIASTIFRGIDYIQIPTTLLSQIDSSVGGKVGINLPKAKNSLGSIYPPKMVLIDPSTLKYLPSREFNNGVAEMIKYGLIYSPDIYDKIKSGNIYDNLDELICECLKIKKHFVEIDEFDTAQRQILNFGHTFGHAYEAFYNYEKYLHGEAIALGMLQVIDPELKNDLIKVLQKYSLPTSDPAKKEDLIKFIKHDKKIQSKGINIVLVNKIGEAYIKAVNIEEL
ncbi:MAG: 3-dehydroquinate synthase [Candidatus Izemoplasmatales bacterium]|nr:3-dehydroquinate synthase [Candidatus Izemoplasmatales bacterium]